MTARNDRQGGFRQQRPTGKKRTMDRFQNNDQRGKKNNNPAIPAPALEGQKPQQRKNKEQAQDVARRKSTAKDDEDRMPKGRKQKNGSEAADAEATAEGTEGRRDDQVNRNSGGAYNQRTGR